MTLKLHHYGVAAAKHYRFYDTGVDLTAAGFEVLLGDSDWEPSVHYDMETALGGIVVVLAHEIGQTWAVMVDRVPPDGRLDALHFLRDEVSGAGIAYLADAEDVHKAMTILGDEQSDEAWTFVRTEGRTELLDWTRGARSRGVGMFALVEHLEQVHVVFEYCAESSDTLLIARPTSRWRTCVDDVLARFADDVVRH